MTDLHKAEAAAREADAAVTQAIAAYRANKDASKADSLHDKVMQAREDCAETQRDLLAALDAARGEAVAWQYQGRDGVWREFLNEAHKSSTEADGTWPMRPLYAAPPAAPTVLTPDVLLDMAEPLRPLLHTPEHWRMVRKYGGAVAAAALAQQPAASVPDAYVVDPALCTDDEHLGAEEAHARGWNACRAAMLAAAQSQQPAAAVAEGYAAAIKAVQEMMPPRDFRPSAQVWLTGNQVNELHARLDAAALLAAANKENNDG